jgi:lysophospholipase L1-like esterase
LALGAALAVICPAVPGVASAEPLTRQQQQQPQQKRVYKIYVVGDSYSSGEGIHTTRQTGRGAFTGPSYFDVRDPRHQSRMSAAIQAAARVQAANPDIQVEVHVVAASGAATSDFFEAQRRDPLDARPGNPPQDGADPKTWHDKDDLMVNSAQLDQIPADADVVIMGFGGNDSYFGPLARTYYKEQDKRPALLKQLEQLLDAGKSAAEYQREADDQSIEKGYAPTLVARMLQVMQAIQNRAKNAKILVQNYPLATHPDHTSYYDMLDDDAMGAVRDFATRINTAIQRAVEICGCAELADVSQAMAGRELNTADPAITSPSTGTGGNAQHWATNEALHPNLKGAALMADPIAAALAKQLGLKTPAPQQDRPADTSKIKITRTPAPDTDGDGRPDYLDSDWDGDDVPNNKDDNPNTPDAKPSRPQGGGQGTTAPDNRQGGAPAAPSPGATGRGNPAAPPQNQTPQPPGSDATPGSPAQNQAPPPATGRPTTPPQNQAPPPAADRPTPPSPGQPPPAPPGAGGPGRTPPPAQQPAPQQPPAQQPPAPPQNSSGGGKTSQSKAPAAASRRGPVIPASTPMRSVAAPSFPTPPSATRFDPNFGPPGSPKPSQLGGGLAGVNPPTPPTVTGPSIPKPTPPLSGGGKRSPQPKPGGHLSTAPSGGGGGGGSAPSTGGGEGGGGGTGGGGSSAPTS